MTNSDKYYERKTKKMAMRTAPIMVGEQGVVTESIPEKILLV